MDIKEQEEIKKEFQLERVILFSDAVFAIILTIMVLEIRLPEGMRDATEEHLAEALKELIFKFMAYFISFFLVGQFWIKHLKLFRYLKDYNTKVLILNLAFLFTVSLFPFTVSLISGNISLHSPKINLAWSIYFAVVLASNFMQTLISGYLIKNKEDLCVNAAQLETVFKWKSLRFNLVFMPLIIAAAFVVYYNGLPYNYMLYVLMGYAILLASITKMYYPKPETKGPILIRLFKSMRGKKVTKVVEEKVEVEA
jgi:uncharacterized membrane protein